MAVFFFWVRWEGGVVLVCLTPAAAARLVIHLLVARAAVITQEASDVRCEIKHSYTSTNYVIITVLGQFDIN